MRTLGLRLCLPFGCMVLWVAPAQALTVHKFQAAFGTAGAGPGQLSKPWGVAVNDRTGLEPAAGDVYVLDSGNNRVARFSASGAFLGQFNGSGTYEVEGKVETGAAAPTGTLSSTTLGVVTPWANDLIAVDNSSNPLDPSAGDVYVIDPGHGVIDKFSGTGAYIGQITGTKDGAFQTGEGERRSIMGVAVDQAGQVWTGTRLSFEASGESFSPIYTFSDAVVNQEVSVSSSTNFGPVYQLAVDAEDNLYFGEGFGLGNFVKADSTPKTLIAPFGGEAGSIAVDPSGRRAYLDNGEAIETVDLSGNPIESARPGAPAPSFGGGHLTFSPGVAVNATTGNVYATDSTKNDVSSFEPITLPSVTVGAPSSQQPRTATLNGTVNPEGSTVTSCVFEYDTKPYVQGEAAHGTSVVCAPASLGSGASPVAVSANVSGLSPQTTYYYRLAAENGGGRSTSAGQELFTGPRLGAAFTTDVAATSVTLDASVDPNGADPHYYFEYGPTTAYGSFAPAAPPGVDLGAAPGPQTVSAHVQGLTASTGYHYQLVVSQGGELFEGGDHSFTSQPAGSTATLADGRAWELVSPANSGGSLIELQEQEGLVQAAADGSGITYLDRGPPAGGEPAGHVTLSQQLSRRGAGGWSTVDLTLPGELPENEEPPGGTINSYDPEYKLFSPDLSHATVEPAGAGTPLLSPEATERTLYIRDNTAGGFLPLVTPANIPAETTLEEPHPYPAGVSIQEWELHYLTATPDLAHVLFRSQKALTPEAIDEETLMHPTVGHQVQWNLYEWSAGVLQLVNILPGPAREVAHGAAPRYPGVRLANETDLSGAPEGGAQRAISTDGRRVAWTWGEPYTSNYGYRGLFVRDMVAEETKQVGGAEARYQTMNADGSKVLYLEHGELYQFDFETGTATDLTAIHGPGEASAGVEEAVSNVSEDGSYVYFVATGALAEGASGGAPNLFVLHDTGAGWTTAFIATLSSQDTPTWYTTALVNTPDPGKISSRVSPNGRYLAFMSNRSLTGYDNLDAVSGQANEEVYLYDAATARLVCASCNPSGERPHGVFDSAQAELAVDKAGIWTSRRSDQTQPRTDHWLAGSIPGWDDFQNTPSYQPRYLSNSGRLFFNSPDALVPQDTNGLEDVYQFEPEGLGNCTPAVSSATEGFVGEVAGHRVDGCVGLISSGTSSSESSFYDASESGDDVFFNSTTKLVPGAQGTSYHLYDAHVCSAAAPCLVEGVKPPPCVSADACKPAPAPQPEFYGPPASQTFRGVGNTAAATPPPASSPKPLTTAQRRARALAGCRKLKQRRPRLSCEKRVRKLYAARRSSRKAHR